MVCDQFIRPIDIAVQNNPLPPFCWNLRQGVPRAFIRMPDIIILFFAKCHQKICIRVYRGQVVSRNKRISAITGRHGKNETWLWDAFFPIAGCKIQGGNTASRVPHQTEQNFTIFIDGRCDRKILRICNAVLNLCRSNIHIVSSWRFDVLIVERKNDISFRCEVY